MSRDFSRRQFVKAAASTAAVLAPAVHASGKGPAADRVLIGLIGCGGRGRQLLEVIGEFSDVEVPVVSDVIEPRMEQAAEVVVRGSHGRKPDRVVEHERRDPLCNAAAETQLQAQVLFGRLSLRSAATHWQLPFDLVQLVTFQLRRQNGREEELDLADHRAFAAHEHGHVQFHVGVRRWD